MRFSASGRFRRVSPVAVRPGEGLLTEPTTDARACRWELLKMPPFGLFIGAAKSCPRAIVIDDRPIGDPDQLVDDWRGWFSAL